MFAQLRKAATKVFFVAPIPKQTEGLSAASNSDSAERIKNARQGSA
jgi:hypothetical protein